MKEKIKDGGWRNDVVIKDSSLIEYHENTFKSNLKAILNGDNDSRVTVQDWRNKKINKDYNGDIL